MRKEKRAIETLAKGLAEYDYLSMKLVFPWKLTLYSFIRVISLISLKKNLPYLKKNLFPTINLPFTYYYYYLLNTTLIFGDNSF